MWILYKAFREILPYKKEKQIWMLNAINNDICLLYLQISLKNDNPCKTTILIYYSLGYGIQRILGKQSNLDYKHLRNGDNIQ